MEVILKLILALMLGMLVILVESLRRGMKMRSRITPSTPLNPPPAASPLTISKVGYAPVFGTPSNEEQKPACPHLLSPIPPSFMKLEPCSTETTTTYWSNQGAWWGFTTDQAWDYTPSNL